VVVRDRAGDAEGLVLARRVVGDDVELYVDANGAYRAKQAIRLGQRMSEARR
jgi:L-alanine-DL-glutamate epimerase-like enolase superfamily enzyme